jgi:GTPase SAR1 family protein
MRTDFYSGSSGVLLVFDLTNLKSFDSVSKWYKDIKDNIRRDMEIIGYVIGNKNDLKNERRISINEIAKLADALDLKFLETSALTGENIDDAFYSIAKSLYLKNK